MVLDALISVTVVVGGFRIANAASNPSRAQVEVAEAGVVAYSANQLADHIHKLGEISYWLGPISGAMYTLTRDHRGISTISYLGSGQEDLYQGGKPKLVIVTYPNSHEYKAGVHALQGVNSKSATDAHGDLLNFDPFNGQSIIITLKKSGQVVVINYPVSHTALSMTTDAESLVLIS